MQVLIDTNVLLDVLLKREPWVSDSYGVWLANDQDRIAGYIAACSITDLFYVARRLTTLEKARMATYLCLEAFSICTVDRRTLELAQTLSGSDFEDNLQIACASIAGLDAIVTRDTTGFGNSLVPIFQPRELLAQLG